MELHRNKFAWLVLAILLAWGWTKMEACDRDIRMWKETNKSCLLGAMRNGHTMCEAIKYCEVETGTSYPGLCMDK